MSCPSTKMSSPLSSPSVPNSNLNESIAQSKVNIKTAWWKKHKDEPHIIECMREARRKYYYKNQEREQERGREYYYKRKALLEAQLQKEV